MRVSFKWLKELVPVDVAPEKLGEMLSMSGTKLESIHRPGASIGDVVVAEVLAVKDHPKADNLTLVEVDSGDGTRSVVCGARNLAVGDRVPLAQVGARLGAATIAERRIRGEVSQGMLCSGAELGVAHDHSGILVLPGDLALGSDIVAALGLDDAVLEFEITPNRPDCMGIIGIAREVAALLGAKLQVPDAQVGEADVMAAQVEVEIVDPAGCPRYVARYIEGLAVAGSPAWLAARLMTAGVRPISNVVDATNYVLLETGHPLHAFDAARVTDGHIVVRRADQGEELVTLDGSKRSLDPDDLVIADPARPLGMAGVMGGEDSEVSGDTTAVILEAAYFDPPSIGRTSRRHVLRTEASARFERGADPDMPPYAAARALALMAELGGGRPSGAVVDAYPRPIERPRVTLRAKRTSTLLGYEVDAASQARHLESIGVGVERAGARLEAGIPSWRPDLRIEEDLIEEVARLAGFDRLPATLPSGVNGGLEPAQALERHLRRTLSGTGMREAWTSPLSSQRDLDALGLGEDHPARKMVVLANPMLEDESSMRTTLLPGLLRAAAHNLAHHTGGVALFEMSRVYEPTGGLPREPLTLGAVWSGTRTPQTWRGPVTKWDFFAAKGVLEATFEAAGVEHAGWSPVSGMPLHPTRAANVSVGGHTAGTLGELHPDVCERFDVARGTVVAELALPALFASPLARVKAAGLSRFPAVYIDLAVVVDEAIPAATVTLAIQQAGAPEATSVRLFDLYRGEQVTAGRKSLAYALELRSPEGTLTDDDAARVRDRIVDALSHEFGAELRA